MLVFVRQSELHTYVGNGLLSGRGGLVWAKELQDGFVESDGTVVGESAVKAGRATAGGRDRLCRREF